MKRAMGRTAPGHPLLGCVLLVWLGGSAAVAGPAAEWMVRRAHVADQKEEWTQHGYLPAWKVEVGAGDPPVIEIHGDGAGAYRGTVLVGRRWRVPAPLPASVQVRLRYQTYCGMNDPAMLRAGQVRLAIFTPARWAAFAVEPERAQIWDPTAREDGVLVLEPIHLAGEDVTEWRDWESA
ncbi:MAG: hypothetical protein QHJ73_12515, partial [Armatimonadota bacterium]|nr:hypothetical protein [Armatimonadota bacterium]